MTSAWKINGKTLEELNVSSLDIDLVNMGADVATIRLAQAAAAALPSVLATHRQTVSVTKDSAQVFYGYRGNPVYGNGPVQQFAGVKVFNAWGWMERMPWSQVDGYSNHNGTTYWPVYSATGKMADVLTGALSIILQLIPGLFAIGTIDVPDQTVAIGRTENQYAAGVIRAILSQAPDAVVTFDYSTTPPRLNVSVPTGTFMTSFPLFTSYADKLADSGWEDRLDLKAAAVGIDYVAGVSKTTTRFAPDFSAASEGKTETSEDLLSLVSRDAAGSGLGAIDTLWNVVRLDGSYDVQVFEYAQPSANWFQLGISLGYFFKYQSALPHYPNLWRLLPNFAALVGQYPWLSSTSPNYFQVIGWRGTSEVFDSSLLTNYGTDRTIIPPAACVPPQELLRSAAFPTGYDVGEADIYLRFDQTSPGTGIFETTITVPVMGTYAAGSTSVSRNGQTLARAFQTPSGSLAAGSGGASKIMAQAGQLRADGEAIIQDGEPVIIGPSARKIAMPSGATAIIQKIGYRVFSGQTTIQAGPPAHLRPDDMRKTLGA